MNIFVISIFFSTTKHKPNFNNQALVCSRFCFIELERLRANPLDAELGYLKALRGRVSSPWTECVELVWSCRNAVSHYQLLDKDKFTEFTKQATAVL